MPEVNIIFQKGHTADLYKIPWLNWDLEWLIIKVPFPVPEFEPCSEFEIQATSSQPR